MVESSEYILGKIMGLCLFKEGVIMVRGTLLFYSLEKDLKPVSS